jgi:hypothetical protein
MKKIKLTQKTANVGGKIYGAREAIREIVMTRPAWRKPGNVKVAISLEDKFDNLHEGNDLILSDREHELLVQEAMMQDSGGINPPQINRLYLYVLESLHDAVNFNEEAPSKTIAPS